MIDNFGFLECVPLILEQTLPDKFFGTSTAPTTTHGRVCSKIIPEWPALIMFLNSPFVSFLWVVLFYNFTALGLYRDYLFIDGMTMLRFDFDAIASDQFK